MRQAPTRTVYAVKHVGAYDGIGGRFAELMQHMGNQSHRLKAVFAVFLDNSAKVPAAKLTSYACAWLEGEAKPVAGVEVKTLPEGLVAHAVAKGPYGGKTVRDAYHAIYAWVKRDGRYEAMDIGDHTPFEETCREFYPDDPAVTKPEDLVTEIEVPLRPRAR